MACVNHPDVPEVTRCSQCFRRVCENCHVVLDGQPLCGDCKTRTVRQIERGELPSSTQRGPSPWEREKSWASFVATVKAAMLSPGEFFRGLQHGGSGHVSFAIAASWPGLFVGSLIYLIPGFTESKFGGSPAPGLIGGLFMVLLVGVLLPPLQILLQVYLGGAILHLCLKATRGANAPFEATCRVLAYATAPNVLAIIPICGAVVGGLWALVVQVVGAKEMHETTYGRVIMAVLLPLLVICVCAAAVLVPMMMVGLARR
jgi:hypothetical protein